MFGDRAQRPGARRRPHRPPADARRQPARVERQPDAPRPTCAGRLRAIRDARRQVRRRRPAAHADRRGGRRAPLHPARHRRAAAVRDRAHAVRRGPGRPRRRLAEHCDGLDEVASVAARLHARARRAGQPASRPPTIRRHRARARGARSAPRSTAASARATQEFGTLASWLVDVAQRPHRQPRPAGRRDVPRWPPAGQRNATGEPGQGRGVRSGAGSQPRARAARVFGELPVACLAEEIDTPGDGQVRALSRSPATRCVSTPNSGRLDRALDALDFMVSLDIYVNETTRHADVILPPPTPLASALRPGALPARGPQRGELLAARRSTPTGPPREWEVLLALAGSSLGPGRRRRRGRARPTRDRRAGRSASCRDAAARRWRAATPTSCSPSSSRAAAPSACSTSCCAPARTATGSAPTRTG